MNRKFLSMITLLVLDVTLSTSGLLFGSDTLARPSRTYDAQHYRIEVRFDADRKQVIGSTTVTLVPLRSKLDSLILHAVDMDVSSLTIAGGKPLRYVNDRQQLTVFLDRTYSVIDTLRIRVDYSCTPSAGMYFIAPDSSDPTRHRQIWSQGEDMDNRNWFPCWDYPNDQATSEVIATVQDSWTVLSNGTLLSVKHDRKNKTKTFHWSQAKPHVAYLVMLVAGEYKVITEKYRNIPLEYYVYGERAEDGAEEEQVGDQDQQVDGLVLLERLQLPLRELRDRVHVPHPPIEPDRRLPGLHQPGANPDQAGRAQDRAHQPGEPGERASHAPQRPVEPGDSRLRLPRRCDRPGRVAAEDDLDRLAHRQVPTAWTRERSRSSSTAAAGTRYTPRGE